MPQLDINILGTIYSIALLAVASFCCLHIFIVIPFLALERFFTHSLDIVFNGSVFSMFFVFIITNVLFIWFDIFYNVFNFCYSNSSFFWIISFSQFFCNFYFIWIYICGNYYYDNN